MCPVRNGGVFMSTPDFKTHIKNIRKEALKVGYSIATMDGYQSIWDRFIKWKNEDYFEYSSNDYDNFLLNVYSFDVNTYNSKSKSHFQQLMRSKRILEDFDNYKLHLTREILPNALYLDYPSEWNIILDDFLNFCLEIQSNSSNTIKHKRDYLTRILSYFHQNKVTNIKELNKSIVVKFVNNAIDKGNVSKRRNFYVLREFLQYLFIEDILKEDLSIYVPKIRRTKRKKIPTYLKQEEVETLLESIPKTRKVDIRNYTIILIAARLGLRINEILNIKLKDIDWQNNKLNIYQSKTNNLNILPLSKEVGWAIIDYIKKSRPKCDNEYLFVKLKYPFDKMKQFSNFNKYFDKLNIEIKKENKKGIHNLRHSLATNMLNNDIPLEIIASTLGQSSIDTTSNNYLKIDIKNLKSCGLEIDE